MKRVVRPELLDSDEGTPEEIAGSLHDIAQINRWFGGNHATALALQRILQRTGLTELDLLDVGAGSGDPTRHICRRMRGRGIRIAPTWLDRAWSHLPRDGSRSVAGDALALPFRDASFDVVACALLAHHLQPEQIVAFVNEGLRVARVAVVINDLRRSYVHLALAHAVLPFFRNYLTYHDGVVSVRRAYMPAEMRAMLQHTHAAAVEVENHYLFRMAVIAWKR